MGYVKAYYIPYWGELGNFGITHVEKEVKHSNDQITEAGYYGCNGGLTITERCKSLEEAEEALKDAICLEVGKEKTNFERGLTQLENIGNEVRDKGLSGYLVK